MSNCNPLSTTKKDVYLAKVESVFSNDQCPEEVDITFDTPFFDETLHNKFITIPIKGNEFIIHVPSTSRWAIGQWVYIEQVGKFPITSIINNTQLVLTNQSDIESGRQFAGSRKIWISEPVLIPESENAAKSLEETMSSVDFNFCAFTKENKSTENGNPIAAILDSSLCDPCGNKTNETESKKCFRYFKNIIFKYLTIALPFIPRTAISSSTFKKNGLEVISPLQDLLWHPELGDLYRRDMPSTNAVDSYTQGGKTYALVPNDYSSNFYILGPNKDTGKPEWRSFNQPVIKFIGTNMSLGSVNIKTLAETALGITLPLTGQIQVNIWAQISAIGANGNPLISATANEEIITSIRSYDNIGTGSKMITVNLSSPIILLAGTGSTFNLEFALVPASMLLN